VRQVLILEEAAEDIAAAKDFYECIDAGLGDYFFDSIMTDLESLGLFHGIHARHFGFQRMLASRFPFGIYYEDTSDATRVFAVLDLRRDPTWIRVELSGRPLDS
jgi:hypothetical protein